MSEIIFISKILLLSLLISVLVKYGGQNLIIPATSSNALLFVFIPFVILLLALSWKYNSFTSDRNF